jgi:hypothetical protein
VGAVYQLTSRGNAKQMIFLEEKNFADFLFGKINTVRYLLIVVGYIVTGGHCNHRTEGGEKMGNSNISWLYWVLAITWALAWTAPFVYEVFKKQLLKAKY